MRFALLLVPLSLGIACSGEPPPPPSPPPPPAKTFRFEVVYESTVRVDQTRDGAIDLAHVPDDSGETFVIYRDGLIEHRGVDHEVLASRKLTVRQNNECGGLAIEVDPNYANNGLVYVGYCVTDGDVDLRVFAWDDAQPMPLPDDELTLIMRWEKGVNDFHNLGDLGWDADVLWITYGDGNRDLTAPQNRQDLRGKLLRISPNRDGTEGYTIPPDNPFVANSTVADEIVVWGLKSTFRADFQDGRWFLGEVGLDSYEEINIVTLAEPRPNLGYILCEGPMSLDANYDPTNEPCSLEGTPDYHPPDLFYAHDPQSPVVTEDPEDQAPSTRGFGITGGVYYQGVEYEGRMTGRYLYSDNQRHFVRRAKFEDGRLVEDEHFAHIENIWQWSVGADGLIYGLGPDRLVRLVFERAVASE